MHISHANIGNTDGQSTMLKHRPTDNWRISPKTASVIPKTDIGNIADHPQVPITTVATSISAQH